MARGPSISFEGLDFHSRADTGLRIITSYYVEMDEIVTRLDVKLGTRQYTAAFRSIETPPPIPGSPITSGENMITPQSGIIGCLNIKSAKAEIIRVLEELLSDIKGDQG